MRAAPQRVGVHATSDVAIRRAAEFYESAKHDAANDQFDADEALEDLIDDAITDADYVAAVAELGLEIRVEERARDIVARRLRNQGASE